MSPYGSRGARLCSYLADFFLLYLFQFSGSFCGGIIASWMIGGGTSRRLIEDAAATGMLLGWVFWGCAAWFLNYGILQGMMGSSAGKLIFGLKVVNQDGSPIGIGKSLGRTCAYILSVIPLQLGFLAIYWNSESRCWHDSIFGTVVIRQKAKYPSQVISETATEFPRAA